jgi:hypothetical protein
MPRYFFNTRINGDLVRDTEGVELRDPDHAWELARTTIRELLDGDDTTGDLPTRHLLSAILEVTDDHGDVVLEFPFAEVLLDPAADTPDEPPVRH